MDKILYVVPGNLKTRKKGFEKLLFEKIQHSNFEAEFEIISLTPLYKKTNEYSEIVKFKTANGKNKYIKSQYFKKNVLDYFLIFIGILKLKPLQCILYQNYNACNFINKNQHKYSKIIFITSRSAQLIMPKEFIMDFVDSLGLNFFRKFKSTNNFFLKAIYAYEAYTLVNYEHNLHKKANLCFSVSSTDAKKIGNKTITLPLSIKIPNISPTTKLKKKHNSIVFSGNFSYEPNINAIEWFIEHCLPLLNQQNNSISLYLVGRNAQTLTKKISTLPVFIVGEVNDMFEELSKYEVAIAPMQSGSGMQYKILEAMSVGLPVVTTTLGLGDIQAVPNRDIIVADESNDFVQAIIETMETKEIKESLEANAKKYVQEKHDISKNSDIYFNKIFK